MIISSGQMKVLKNKNGKSAKLFGEVEVGDIIEVTVDTSITLRHGGGSKLITVHNRTKNTNRKCAPTFINSGLDKMTLEPVLQKNEAEYQRGYQDAHNELQDAYIGGYIEDYFEEEE